MNKMSDKPVIHFVLQLVLLFCRQATSDEPNFVNYCNASAGIPSMPDCIRCRGHCDERSAVHSGRLCSCDALCRFYGDCCPDFEEACPDVPHLEVKTTPGRAHCQTVKPDESYILIDECLSDENACRKTQSINSLVPVTDNDTGLHFISYNCAVCNGATGLITWESTMTCDSHLVNQSWVQRQDILVLLAEEACTIHFDKPASVTPPRKCVELPHETCPTDCQNKIITEKCQEGSVIYITMDNSLFYNNFFCAVCNNPSMTESAACYMIPHVGSNAGGLPVFSFPLLLDVDLRQGITVGGKEGTAAKCEQGSVWIFEENSCRPVIVLDSNMDSHLYERKISFRLKLMARAVNIKKMEMSLQNAVEALLPEGLSTTTECVNGSSNIDCYINMTLPPDSPVLLEKRAEEMFIENLRKNLSLYYGIDFMGVQVSQFSKEGNATTKPLLNCSLLKYQEHEYNISDNGSIILLESKRLVGPSMFYIDRHIAYVCMEPAKPTSGDMRFPAGVGIVSLVCLSLSVLALIIRLGLHCAFRDSDTASIMQVSLASALLVANLSFLLGPFVVDVYPACYTVAVITHWSFLAAFSWTFVVAMDIFRMLRYSQRLRLIGSRKKALYGYSLFAWGFPSIIVCVAIGLDHCNCIGNYAPAYGRGICFISSRYSSLVFFVSPVAAHITMNVIFFASSAVILCASKSMTANVSNNKHRFSLYLRLLVLMGTTWLFAFLAMPLNSVALWYIFTVLNASQGVYLLVTYVTTKTTRDKLMKCVKCGRESGEKGTVTDSTSLRQSDTRL